MGGAACRRASLDLEVIEPASLKTSSWMTTPSGSEGCPSCMRWQQRMSSFTRVDLPAPATPTTIACSTGRVRVRGYRVTG